jgi:hypothetical protein
MSGICTTRGLPFEPKSAAVARERARQQLRAISEEEERSYREHLPAQIREMRRKRRGRS